MSLPNSPVNLKLAEGYEDVSVDPNDYEGKSVLILGSERNWSSLFLITISYIGRGNAAFELTKSIYGVTNFIHLVSRSRLRNSFSTHYVGKLINYWSRHNE